MDRRAVTTPESVQRATTDELSRRYIVTSLLTHDQLRATYCFEDRLVVGGVVPVAKPLDLHVDDGPISSRSFLSERELGILHVGGGPAVVTVDQTRHQLESRDMLYVGRGQRAVTFESLSATHPARLYFSSAPAHRVCPDRRIGRTEVEAVDLGSVDGASRRRLFPGIHPNQVETANLLMGYTEVVAGSVWNTMPPHLHSRRTEIYFYFELPAADDRIFHIMGEPSATRHIVVRNEQAVISPSWSIHSGVGTSNYSFCWSMAGENNNYTDLDPVAATDLE